MQLRTNWQSWTGGAATAVLAEVADARFKPMSASVTNGNLVNLAAFAADLFGWVPRYRGYVDGGSAYAVGSLVGSAVRGHITPPATTTTTTTTPSASSSGGTFNPLATAIPASGGTAGAETGY